ncbi:hypothetical protein BDN72DRAFT_98436 [Pluteus cervinus]|uniref:Uncharacterized protein n=1 Tax=Pluteus cervinus TaxID=181527 RepID=A0ACD3AN84_9AGAR|nr:hypothetical protein BDN72DRAFT_98436 [Pluteus cervinus]
MSLGSTSFPAELLYFILDDYRPVYDAEVIELIQTPKVKTSKNWAPYASKLHFFAQLRLVCRAWYNFITPLLYSTFTLPTHPYEDLERAGKGLSHYPGLIDRLVLRGHLGDGAAQHAAELLAACLSQCTHLRTLEILDAHRIFQSSSKSKSLAIFLAIPPTVPLDCLIFRFLRPNASSLRIYPISITLIGLGSLNQKLKTLEIHDLHRRPAIHPDDYAILGLPSSFPNLQRLVVRSPGFSEYVLSKFISRIFYKITPPLITSGWSSARQWATPLRDLTLFWNGTSQAAYNILDLLKADDLGQNLTSFSIYSDPLSLKPEASDVLLELPAKIIAACPHLEAFVYFVISPDTVFTQLPRTLKTLGLPLINDYPFYDYVWQTVKPLTLNHHKSLVDWLERTNGRGIKNLLLQRATQGPPPGLEGVTKACLAANVELTLSWEPAYPR